MYSHVELATWLRRPELMEPTSANTTAYGSRRLRGVWRTPPEPRGHVK